MKVNVEIDCTPEEARHFFGLPDLRPIQEAVLGAMQQQMLDTVARASPDALLRSWVPMFPQTPDQVQQMMAAFFRGLSPARPAADAPPSSGGGTAASAAGQNKA